MADADIVTKFGNTYDIPTSKWVVDMTDSELISRGYKAKPQETQQQAATQQIAKAKSAVIKKTASK